MYRVEIYYNKYNELTLAQYDENDKLIGHCKGTAVKRLLSKIEDEKISKIFPSGKDTAVVAYDDAYINVHQIDRMDKEPLMQNYLKVLEKALEKQEARETNVTRKNKHSGFAVALGTVFFFILACTTLVGAALAPDADVDKEALTNPPGIHATGEMPSQNKTNTTIFGTGALEEIPQQTEEEYMFLEYDDRTDTEKYKTTVDLYGDTIEKYANMYGLDPQLVLAIATQERGVHSDKMDPGGATGLMQIQNGIWEDEEIRAFNFATGEYETYKITKEKIQNCETNIKIGCMILQNYIKGKGYNISLGVASYNMGPTNISKVLNAYSETSGLSKDEIINDQHNNNWMQHLHIITVGDQRYNKNVYSYLGDDFTTFVLKPNGEKVELTVKNFNQTKTANR